MKQTRRMTKRHTEMLKVLLQLTERALEDLDEIKAKEAIAQLSHIIIYEGHIRGRR